MTSDGLAPYRSPDSEEKAAAPTVAKRGRGFIIESIRVIVPLLILAAGFGFLLISGKLKKTPQQPPSVAGRPRVQTAALTAYDGEISLDVDGLVVPFREITLTSEVAGSIKKKYDKCRAGRYVKAGELLLEIDPIDYELELRRLTQEHWQAKFSVNEIDVQLENLTELKRLAEQEIGLQSEEVGRLRSLANDRVVAKSDFDRAKSTEINSRNALQLIENKKRLLEAQLKSMEAAVKLAATRIDQAELNVARTKITAPVDGVIVRDLVEEGAFVQRGSAVATFEDTSAVEVQCNLMNEELAWLMRGQPASAAYSLPKTPAKIIFKRGSKRFVWDAHLSRFDGVGLDQKTRMFPCRVLVDDPTGGRLLTTASVVDTENQDTAPALVRGMYVTVDIQVPPENPLAVIPRKALQLGNVVWRVRDGKLTIVPVSVAKRFDHKVLIELSGGDELAMDDRVVVSPLTTVADDMLVEDMDEGNPEQLTTERVDESDQSQERETGAAT